MIKRCAVIGLGRFGTEVVRWLESHNIPVLAIDSDKDVVQKVADEENVTGALCMDCTDESALLEADITSMEVVVVAIGDHHVENSIMVTALLKQLGVKRIVARASSELHANILKKVGATEAVNPEKEMGLRVARMIYAPNLREVIPFASGASIAEVDLPKSFVGKSMIDLRLRDRYGVNVIGIKRLPVQREENERFLMLSPDPHAPLEENDILVVVGTDTNVRKFTDIK
ncbi:TrkA family potassium uptake protein [bacterium]|nr:TrkA family potassium uptake protein [bacterium]MBQ7555804.1 TrkA family potassium uptake protein [bacterium]MBR6462889.1 TrkA family potassium uptake protein [bacterium]